MQIGDRVKYISYGAPRFATITHFSHDGKIVFLDNKRFLHRGSVECVQDVQDNHTSDYDYDWTNG